jgi:hypothetical protein
MSEMTTGNPPELSIYTFFKMKDRRAKRVFSGDGFQWEEVGHKERVKEGQYGGCVL